MRIPVCGTSTQYVWIDRYPGYLEEGYILPVERCILLEIVLYRQEYLSNRISFGYWRDVELYRRPKPSNMLLWMVIESLGESDIDVYEVSGCS